MKNKRKQIVINVPAIITPSVSPLFAAVPNAVAVTRMITTTVT